MPAGGSATPSPSNVTGFTPVTARRHTKLVSAFRPIADIALRAQNATTDEDGLRREEKPKRVAKQKVEAEDRQGPATTPDR
jgi:hypothetical protein